MKILSVDDHAENLSVLGAVLRRQGHTVDAASDGREALQLAETGGYDLIISDILMPRMDGFQLCREVRRHARLRHLPFIFYTATYTDARDESFALSLGADRFLVKPLDPASLVRAIGEVLAAKAAGAPGPARQVCRAQCDRGGRLLTRIPRECRRSLRVRYRPGIIRGRLGSEFSEIRTS